MKKFLSLTLVLLTFKASALDSLCLTKQKNAASFALAQEIGVEVQAAEVIRFTPGEWTASMSNNIGRDKITVRIGNRKNRGMTIKSYSVIAVQIGSSDDCIIQSSIEVEN